MLTYEFASGEDISLALDAVQGDPTTVSGIAAYLKALNWRAVLPAGAPVAATFQITPRAADGTIPPGWTLLIPAATAATLQAGTYVADARLSVAGGTAITEQVGVRLRAAVTS